MRWVMPIAAQFNWPADGLAALVVKVSLWAFAAFCLWIPLALLLQRLKLPQPLVFAAILSWIGTGLSLPWVLAHAAFWVRPWLRVMRGFLAMRF